MFYDGFSLVAFCTESLRCFFDAGLLWSRGNDQLVLREPSSPSIDIHLPTWSWMAWSGSLSLSGWRSGQGYTKSNVLHDMSYTSMCTIPLVRWYHGAPHDPNRRRIHNDWLSYAAEAYDEEQVMGHEWSRHKHTPEVSKRMWTFTDWTSAGNRYHATGWCKLRERDHYYTHKSDPMSEFWYPIPLIDSKVQSSVQFHTNSKTHDELSKSASLLISCSTTRASLCVGEKLRFHSAIPGYEKGEIVIRDKSGRWAGCLILQYHLDFDETGHSMEENLNVGDALELVAISQGFAYNDWVEHHLCEWHHEERPRSGEKYEWYNVLWVDWHDGIAKRNAVGRIHKAMWEDQALEVIDLVLG